MTSPGTGGAGWRRLAAAVVLLGGLAAFVLHAGGFWFFTEDDAYIIARYSRNLGELNGLVYEPGAREWGCTTTLLPVALAPFARWGVDPVTGSKVLNTLAMLAGLLFLARLTARRAPVPLALLSVFLPAAFGPLALWTVGGLETGIFVALLVLAMDAAVGERDGRGAIRLPRSAVAYVACVLTRYDAVLYFPAVLGLRGRSQWLRWSLGVGGALAVLWAIHAVYYSSATPNSFEAKVAGFNARFEWGWAYLRSFTGEFLWLLVPTAVLGGWLSFWGSDARRPIARLMLLGLVLNGAYTVWAGRDWMPFYRFFAPAIVFCAPLWAWAAAEGLERRWWSPRIAVAGATVAVLAVAVYVHGRDQAWLPRLYVLRTGNELFNRLGALGKGMPDDVRVAVADVGAIGWESGARVLDFVGLVSRSLATSPKTAAGPRAMEVLERTRPDVVLVKSYVGGDHATLRAFHEAIVRLKTGPLAPHTVRELYRHPRSQGDADGLRYVLDSGDFILTTAHAFPGMPQFYLVFVRASAAPRLPEPFLSTRLFPGEAHYRTGDVEHGLALLEEELLSLPYNPFGYVAQAERLLRAGRPQRAAWWLKRAATLLALDARTEFVYGVALGASGAREEAVRAYQRSLKLAPNNVDALNNLGFELGVLKRFDEAEKSLRRALELQPGNALVRRNLEWVLRRGR